MANKKLTIEVDEKVLEAFALRTLRGRKLEEGETKESFASDHFTRQMTDVYIQQEAEKSAQKARADKANELRKKFK